MNTNTKNGKADYVRVTTNLNGIQMQKRFTKGATVEELLQKIYQKQLPYRVLTSKINNHLCNLTTKISEECEIQLLDMRSMDALRVYQRSLTFLYIRAVYDLFGQCDVVIQNPLNKGLYSEIRTEQELTEEDVAKIEKRMWELVAEDVPFIKKKYARQEALDILERQDMWKTRQLLVDAEDVQEVTLYSCGELRDYFYGHMVPSAGYIEHFDLRKYKKGVLIRHPDRKDPKGLPSYFDDKKLFEMFEEAAGWGRLMNISYASDLNEKIASGEVEDVIKISEALHEKKVAAIADAIEDSKRRIVLICGPSSSGKTTFANRLMIQLRVNGKHPVYIGTDDYFVERVDTPVDEFGKYNFEDIEAIDIELFNRNLNQLLAGEVVDLPTFDFIEGKKIFGKRLVRLQEGQPIVIEGIHGLNNRLTPKIPDDEKFKIYISPLTQLGVDNHNRISTTDGRLIRRIVRDKQFRGYNARKTLSAWEDVRKGEEKNIFPYNQEADVMFNSALIYELSALRPIAEPLLEEIQPEDAEYVDARRILTLLQHFRPLEDMASIANNSILREFIGGSVFFK